MKKFLALTLVLCMMLLAVACGEEAAQTKTTAEAQKTEETAPATESPTEPAAPAGNGDDEKSEGVMTYAEFAAAEIDAEVTIETFVQAKESWWQDKATVYTQDADGGYFLYDMPCSEEEYAKLVPGTKIRVKGYKAEWSGEIEITEAEFEILNDSTYLAEATDVTALLGTDELIGKQNMFVAFKGMKVVSSNDEGAAYLYKYDGSGSEGDDLYFKIADEAGNTYQFDVRSYLCDKDSDVYKAVKELKVGDTIDMEGFLYWYEGPQARITGVTVK